MAIKDIISALDAEINRLKGARSLLATLAKTTSLHVATGTKPAAKRRKRKLSAEARERIAEAQRQRWAKQKTAK